MKKFLAALALTVAATYVAVGFTPQTAGELLNDPKTTPAYGVLVLRKVVVEAELADLASKFTDSSQVVQAKRFEFSAVNREMVRMQRIKGASVSKLSGTYGNLILQKVALEVELNSLLHSLTPQHPDVRKKQVEFAALERELRDMLE